MFFFFFLGEFLDFWGWSLEVFFCCGWPLNPCKTARDLWMWNGNLGGWKKHLFMARFPFKSIKNSWEFPGDSGLRRDLETNGPPFRGRSPECQPLVTHLGFETSVGMLGCCVQLGSWFCCHRSVGTGAPCSWGRERDTAAVACAVFEWWKRTLAVVKCWIFCHTWIFFGW